MSLTNYEGRTLPSVFSDLGSRNEVQEARQRIGRMGMWIFVLLGAVLLAIAAAAYAFYLYEQQREDFGVLQDEMRIMQQDVADYRGLSGLRDRVLTERRALLDTLEARNRNLTDRQIRFGWEAALSTCDTAGPGRLCFVAERGGPRETNERSQTWAGLLTDTNTRLQDEIDVVIAAKQRATTAQITNAPPPQQRPCDPMTDANCR